MSASKYLDGMIYFSDASTKFGAKKSGGRYEGGPLDIMERGGAMGG
jgi:hypothetical protein